MSQKGFVPLTKDDGYGAITGVDFYMDGSTSTHFSNGMTVTSKPKQLTGGYSEVVDVPRDRTVIVSSSVDIAFEWFLMALTAAILVGTVIGMVEYRLHLARRKGK